MVKHGVTFFLHDFIGKLHGEPAEGADEGSKQSFSEGYRVQRVESMNVLCTPSVVAILF